MNTIRNLFSVALIALTAFVVCAPPDLQAQNVIDWSASSYGNPPNAINGPTSFTGAGVTNAMQGQHSNLVWFCASAKGVGVPQIQNLFGLQGDLVNGTATTTFWSATNACPITNNGIAGTNVLYLDNSGTALSTCFSSNDLAIIHFYTNDVYQLVVVTNVAAGALSISAGAKFATGTGDIIYKLITTGTLIEPGVTATNISPATGYIAAGRMGFPLAVTLEYSNTARLRLVSGQFGDRPPNRHF